VLVWSVAEYQSGSSCCYVSIATAARLELVCLCGVVVQPAAAAPVRGHRSEEDSAGAENAVIVHGLSFLSAASATLIRSILQTSRLEARPLFHLAV